MIRKYIPFAAACIALLALGSCHKFEGGQSVPAYIHIEALSLDCDYSDYGANTHNFIDAWVAVDEQTIGCFELPSTFPVLKKGKHKVSIRPGIAVNGIGAARSYYPFCKPADYLNLELVEDSIITLNPVINYFPIGAGFNMAWKEDFESAIGLSPTSESDTSIMRVNDAQAWHSENSFYSGRIVLPPDSLDFTVATSEELTFHTELTGDGSAMLEMDYNTNDTMFVGLMYYKNYKTEKLPLVKVLPTDKEHGMPQKWKKIYINLGHVMKEENDASYFKVYFTSDLTTDYDVDAGYVYHPVNEQRYYYLDNLKVIYRPR